ncbi:MAG: SDR family NAD(P)-dependent oxidoreductase [Candidatus Brocadiia bacterium]
MGHDAPVLDRFRLAGRHALVTGASRGIGRACALALAQAGADVALVARSQDDLEAAAAEVREAGARTFVRPADLARPADCEAVVADAEGALGTLDVLLYAAGINLRAPAEEVGLDQLARTLEVNTASAFATAQAIGRRLLDARRPGSLIFIASLMSRGARPTTIPYGVSKMGLGGVVAGLACEWAERGIRANAIAPGYIRTEMTRPLQESPHLDSWVRQRTPMGRWGEPGDIAPLAVFLASDAAAFVTGQTLYCDGGWTAAL